MNKFTQETILNNSSFAYENHSVARDGSVTVSPVDAGAFTETALAKRIAILFGDQNPNNYITNLEFAGANAIISTKVGSQFTIPLKTAFLSFCLEHDIDSLQNRLQALQKGQVASMRNDRIFLRHVSTPVLDFFRHALDASNSELDLLAADNELYLQTLETIGKNKSFALAGIKADDALRELAANELQAIEEEKQRLIKQQQAEELKAKLASFIIQVKEIILGSGCNFGSSVFASKEQIVFRAGPLTCGLRAMSKLTAGLEEIQNGAIFNIKTDEVAEMADAVLIVCDYSKITL